MSNWRTIDEEPMFYGDPVLVYIETPDYTLQTVAVLTPWGWQQIESLERLEGVTHWMPLPQNPTKDTDFTTWLVRNGWDTNYLN